VLEFHLQAIVALFSMFAGIFWMASAYGRTVVPPWKTSGPVPETDLATHQTKWNGRAALNASIAAIAQAISFLVQTGFFEGLTIPSF
jgi:hypothetical protein